MIRLRSLIYALLLSVTFISSSIFATAAEVTIPSYGTFGNSTIDGDIFEFPSVGTEPWAGFAATNEGGGDAYYPFAFSAEGQLTVNAAVPSGGTATLRFVFEYQPHPNNTPNFEVSIPISGSTLTTYTEALPVQGENTFSNFVFYIVEQDTPVQIQDIQVVSDDADPNAPEPGLASETTINQWNVFDGTTVAEGGIFEFPSAAQSWAGFANADNSAYPFSFSSPGQISFTASVPSGGTADVRFRFEYLPWPNVTPDYDTEVVTISGSTDTVYTIDIPSQGENTFSSFLFFINDRDNPVKLGDVVVSDDAGAPSGGTTPDNGISFLFEEATGGAATYSFTTDIAEVTGTDPQSYSITIPAYTDPAATFEGVVLKVTGADQAIAVNDVTLTVGGVTYGGSGADSMVFDIAFGGVAYDSNGNAYTHLSTAESWGGFLWNATQSAAELPADGLVFADTATITFTANLVEGAVSLPPAYDGETAFSNGVIDTSEDTGTGRDSDPPYRWSAYVSWFTLEAGDTQGTYVGGDAWGQLGDLPATWNNGVITLAPNTASYSAWKDPNSDDGQYFLEQTLKIEGTLGTSEILGKTVNFSGTIDSNTLDSRYSVIAFVKALDPENNYAPIVIEQVELSSGNFAISADLPAGNYSPQLGFVLSGRNANPATDWGNIQISNVVASYDETTSITEGNFSNGSNGYWGFSSGVEFNTNGGNGSVPGQVVMTNTGSSRASVYIASNQGNSETIDSFGMAAGSTYDVSYYMNRISGSDLGLVQFAFYVSDTQQWVYSPSSTSGTIHENANPTNGTWVQYTQAVEVPANTTHALLYVISGAQSVIAFDQISVSEQVAENNFANWAANNGLSGTDAGFNADPDGDGIPNGLESFLGTAPGSRSGGMSNIAKTANGLSMQHSKNADLSSDITASYQWSTDLSTWNNSGATVDGTTVSIATEDSGGTTTATATVSGTDPNNVFIKVSVSNE